MAAAAAAAVPVAEPAPEGAVISVRDITKVFGHTTVVNHISLDVQKGEIYGFLGPNGSGKTTFLRMLCGLLHPTAGSGQCLGYDILRQSAQIKAHVGYMTQKFSFYEDLSIQENLDFVARMYKMPRRHEVVQESLEDLGLYHRRKQLAGTLSGGWKQRLALAACLLHRPQLLLLDEPTAGVDPKARRDFWEHIHRLADDGLTFLVTTHYMDEAERCHRLAYISDGNLLIHGTVQEVVDKAGLTVWQVVGPNLLDLAEELRKQPGVEQATMFSTTLHVTAREPEPLERAIGPWRKPEGPYQWQQIKPTLEDVFIYLMNQPVPNTHELAGKAGKP